MNTPWPTPSTTVRNEAAADPLRLTTHVLYALHTLSWFSLGLFSAIAIVVNLVKRDTLPREADNFYVSHYRWQWRSFWFALLWFTLTAPLWLVFVFPGYVAWFGVGLWYLYRFIRGWWAFAERRPMPLPAPH